MKCRDECKNTNDCKWFSFSTSNDRTCLLYKLCLEKDDDILWVTSQKECDTEQCNIPVQCVNSV